MKNLAKLLSLSLLAVSGTNGLAAEYGESHDGYNQETGEFQDDQLVRELDAANAIMEMLNDKTKHHYVSGFTIQDLKCGPKACSFKDGKATLTLTDKKVVDSIKSFLGDSQKVKALTCDLTRDKSPICKAK